MPTPETGIRSMMKQPGAFVPIAMSFTALALVLAAVLRDFAMHGAVIHEADEGAIAHLWQLLMSGQLPVLLFFLIKWLPRAPRQTLCVLALQTGAALASAAPVFFLQL